VHTHQCARDKCMAAWSRCRHVDRCWIDVCFCLYIHVASQHLVLRLYIYVCVVTSLHSYYVRVVCSLKSEVPQ
jgi:hypothetical protein